MAVDINAVMAWEPVIQQLATLGVQSYAAIKAAMTDAGLDDDTIAALAPKWDALVADVKRSAGE